MAIHENRLVEVTYTRRDGKKVTRILEPLAIMFSEYYFYLTAYMLHEDHKQFAVCDDPFPTIYRHRPDRVAENHEGTFSYSL